MDGTFISISAACGGSVSLPVSYVAWAVVMKNLSWLSKNFMIVIASASISPAYECLNRKLNFDFERGRGDQFNQRGIIAECEKIDGRDGCAVKHFREFMSHFKIVYPGMAFADFNKTTPLCFYLVPLPKNSKKWQESFIANSWMGGGVGGFLFPLEDNSENSKLPLVESADSFFNAFDGMSDDLDLHYNSIGNISSVDT
eukprot:scaffold36879_cov17-Cyclotella_meneghiniana.AAC.1